MAETNFTPNKYNPQDIKSHLETHHPDVLREASKDVKVLVSKRTGTVTKWNVKEGEYLNRAIVWFLTGVLKTDRTIDQLFLKEIKDEYRELKKLQREIHKNQTHYKASIDSSKIENLQNRVAKLNTLMETHKKLLGHPIEGRDKLFAKADKLKLDVQVSTFSSEWKPFIQKHSFFDDQEKYYSEGFTILDKFKDTITKNVNNPLLSDATKDINLFLSNYKGYIDIRSKLLLAELKEEFIDIRGTVDKILNFNEKITKLSDKLKLFDTGFYNELESSISDIREKTTAFNKSHPEIIKNAIKNQYQGKLEEIAADQKNAEKGIVKSEFKIQRKIAPIDSDIKHLNKLMDDSSSKINSLQGEIESLIKEKLQLQEKHAEIQQNKDSFFRTIEGGINDLFESMGIGEEKSDKSQQTQNEKIQTTENDELKSIQSQVNTIESKLSLKKAALNSKLMEFQNLDTELQAESAKKNAVLSSERNYQQTKLNNIARAQNAQKELKDLQKKDSPLEKILQTDDINSLVKSFETLEKKLSKQSDNIQVMQEIINGSLSLDERLVINPSEQDRYINDTSNLIRKLAEIPEEFKADVRNEITERNEIDAKTYFNNCLEILSPRYEEIGTKLSQAFDQTPLDLPAIKEAMDKFKEVNTSFSEIEKAFSHDEIGKLYDHNFIESENFLTVQQQKEELSSLLATTVNDIPSKKNVLNEEFKAYEKKMEDSADKLASYDKEISKNQNILSELTESLSIAEKNIIDLEKKLKEEENSVQNSFKKKEGIESTYNEIMEEAIDIRGSADVVSKELKTYQSSLKTIASFIKQSNLRTNELEVSSEELRMTLALPLIEVYNEQKAAWTKIILPKLSKSDRESWLAMPEGASKREKFKELEKKVDLTESEREVRLTNQAMNKKINNLNKEIKSAVETRDKTPGVIKSLNRFETMNVKTESSRTTSLSNQEEIKKNIEQETKNIGNIKKNISVANEQIRWNDKGKKLKESQLVKLNDKKIAVQLQLSNLDEVEQMLKSTI